MVANDSESVPPSPIRFEQPKSASLTIPNLGWVGEGVWVDEEEEEEEEEEEKGVRIASARTKKEYLVDQHVATLDIAMYHEVLM